MGSRVTPQGASLSWNDVAMGERTAGGREVAVAGGQDSLANPGFHAGICLPLSLLGLSPLSGSLGNTRGHQLS